MNPAAVIEALRSGAPLTCATCRFFHEGNMVCGKPECGGPGVGRDFPSYEGPIPREKFVERCLVCGDGETEYLIAMGADKTKFALCRRHRRVYEHVGAPEDTIKLPVIVIAKP